jgi:hypothetical protein|tara:strand:+ start:9489 stop:9650 length:162 start_codon:yes stop_codon:yes gene_type:complete
MKELEQLILDVLEKHYHGRNFIEHAATIDLLDLFKENEVCKCKHFTECTENKK